MKRLFIDMDGTLCRFYEKANCVEKCREPGFFLTLRPYENLVKAIHILRNSEIVTKENFTLHILSSVYSSDAAQDKLGWLKKYFGSDFPAIFVDVNADKSSVVNSGTGQDSLTADDFLLDDYSKNLVAWAAAGGTSIKFRNELNGRGWNGHNFVGHTVYFNQDPDELAHDLLSIMGLIDEEKRSFDEPVTEAQIRTKIDQIMEQEWSWEKKGDAWYTDLYANYDDRLDERSLKTIFENDHPDEAFTDLIDDWYSIADFDERDQISEKVRKELGELGGPFALGDDGVFLNTDVEELYQGLLDGNLFCCNYPYDHYLKQRVNINVMIDTGDGNYDFVKNAVYPHYNGREDDSISDVASIVWLAQTQGFSKEELQNGLRGYKDALDKHGFIETLGQELINAHTGMCVLTFLVETTVGTALDIANALHQKTIDEQASITIGKETETGLYDPIDGAGGPFEIELEKDVTIPLKIIRSADPDDCYGMYSIARVYAMCGSEWKDAIRKINF